MRFENPEYFYLLLLLLPLLGLRMWSIYKQKRKLRLLGDVQLVKKMSPTLSFRRANMKYAICCFIFALIVMLLARPQMGMKVSKSDRNGIEVMIAMDISNSMRVEDVIPTRLDKTKLLIENLVDHFENDRVGMVVFAGDAFVQLPITNDYVSAKMFLQSVSPEQIVSQGTNIADALQMCMRSFTKQNKIGKAIILITDGEDHEGGAEQMAKEALKKGYNVYVLGVGDSKGGPVPDGNGGYIKDEEGNVVISKLNEDMCRSIAAAGEGVYIHVDNNSSAQEKLNSALAKLQKGDMKSVVYSEYDDQFQAVAILILILLIVELLFSETADGVFTRFSKMANKKRVFSTKILVFALLALSLCSASVNAQTDRANIREGNRHFKAKDYEKAEISYRKAVEKNDNNAIAHYNLGCSKMMLEKDSLALIDFSKAADLQKNKIKKAQCFHNMGVIFQNHKEYEKAVSVYRESLRNNPTNNETRYNLSLCQKLLKQQQKNNKNNKNNDKNNDKNKNNNKQQNKKQDKEQQNPQNQQQMSKENAEQLLQAAKQSEQNTQQRVKQAMKQQRTNQRNKNW